MHKLALLMEDIARASVSAVVGLFMLGVAIVIGIIVLVTIMTVLKMAINDISEFFKKIAWEDLRSPWTEEDRDREISRTQTSFRALPSGRRRSLWRNTRTREQR